MRPLPHSSSFLLGGLSTDDAAGPLARVLVPVRSLEASAEALDVAARCVRGGEGRLRLVHVRTWDPPAPGGRSGRPLYPTTSEDATAVLDAAMGHVWAWGVDASGVVVEAEASRIAAAVLAEAVGWAADIVVVHRQPRGPLPPGVWERANAQILQWSPCPALVAGPSRPA